MSMPTQTCWHCKHFRFSTEEPDYSELTPGSPASMSCEKKMWKDGTRTLTPMDTDGDFAKAMEIGFACTQFEVSR